MARGSTLGVTGPERKASGWGPNVCSFAGLPYISGYPDGPPVNMCVKWPDYLVGTMIAATTHHVRFPDVRVFGCPRVGNKRFANLPGHEQVTRYENWFDGVTFTPPRTSPWQAIHSWRHDRPVTLYTHRGASITLPGRGHSMDS